jgi:hypothetical protein
MAFLSANFSLANTIEGRRGVGVQSCFSAQQRPGGSGGAKFDGAVSHLDLRCSDGTIFTSSANRAQAEMTTGRRSFPFLIVHLKVTCPDTTTNLQF